jgi:hypothetical protein
MHLTPTQQFLHYVLWALSFSFQATIVALMVKRNQIRTFPVFFAYTVFELIDAFVIFSAYKTSYTVYFYTWWTSEIVDALITLAVIQEIFLVIFQPYDALRKWGTRLFFSTTIALCLVMLLFANQHSVGLSPRVIVLTTLDRSAGCIEIGLLFALFIFCRLFGMTWRHYVFGIASGLLVGAAIYTVGFSVATYIGTAFSGWTGIVNSSGLFLGILIWTYYFGSAKSRVPLDQVPGTERLIAWNQALGDIGRR